MRLWMQDPNSVMPFSRPFVTSSQLARSQEEGGKEARKSPLTPLCERGGLMCAMTEPFAKPLKGGRSKVPGKNRVV